MIKAIVFDLDDTLYPEQEYVQSGFNAVAEYIQEQTQQKDIFDDLWQLFCEDRRNVLDRLIQKRALSFMPQELHKVYIEHKPTIQLYCDSLDCIKTLKTQGYKLGIITDGRPVQQNNKLDALAIRPYFDKIIITDELGGTQYRKPNPCAFHLMSQSLSTPPESILYIGDNPTKDFAISQHLAIKTTQIKRGGYYESAQYRDDILPDITTNSLVRMNEVLSSF